MRYITSLNSWWFQKYKPPKFKEQKINPSKYFLTLDYLIIVGVRLLIFQQFSSHYALIPYPTFINFGRNVHPIWLFHPQRLMNIWKIGCFSIYRRSPDSTDSISTVPGLVRIANRTILPKFPDIVRFYFAQIPLFM